jgi:hypothetical protein
MEIKTGGIIVEKDRKIIHIQGQAVPVTDDVYYAYYHPIWNTFNFARLHGQCRNRDWKKCSGDCGMCKYRTEGDEVSLERLKDNFGYEIADTESDPALITERRYFLEEVLSAMEQIDPDGREIAELMIAGENDCSIAAVLGITKGAFSRRRARIGRRLKETVNFL